VIPFCVGTGGEQGTVVQKNGLQNLGGFTTCLGSHQSYKSKITQPGGHREETPEVRRESSGKREGCPDRPNQELQEKSDDRGVKAKRAGKPIKWLLGMEGMGTCGEYTA